MEVKSRRKAENLNKKGLGPTKRIKLEPCPFCGTAVVTGVTKNEVRFFDCGVCGLKARFIYSDEEESIELWNKRIELE